MSPLWIQFTTASMNPPRKSCRGHGHEQSASQITHPSHTLLQFTCLPFLQAPLSSLSSSVVFLLNQNHLYHIAFLPFKRSASGDQRWEQASCQNPRIPRYGFAHLYFFHPEFHYQLLAFHASSLHIQGRPCRKAMLIAWECDNKLSSAPSKVLSP